MISIPTKISKKDMDLALNKGSRMAVNKVREERHTIPTDTVEALIEPKNRIQCNPTIPPVAKILKKLFLETLKFVFLTLKYINKDRLASSTLYHTKCTSPMEISAPRIAVNPHIITVKCKIRSLLIFNFMGQS